MAKHMGADKDTEKLIRLARKEWGYEAVSLTKSNHVRFLHPNGKDIFLASLTGSVTSQRKLRSQLKKAGLPIAA